MSIIIRLQNLPWAADSMDIRRYFTGLSIPEGGVHIVGGEMGDAFIAFSTDEDARLAMAKDGGKIHEMQIKLLLSSRTEMMRVIEKARQLNLAMQAQTVPLAPPVVPPPVIPQAPPARVNVPPVEEERRRRSPSPPHRRVSRDKSPGRGDRRRSSPDSRRSSSKRDRSRSPSRGSRGSNRDTDRRDRSKRDDRRHDDSRGRDDRHSGRDSSHDSKKYPETDSFGRTPRSANDGYRESNNHRYNNEVPSSRVSSYSYESTPSTESMKGLPAAFLPQTNQMHPSDPFAVGKQMDPVGVSSSSSSVYMQQPSYGTVSYGEPPVTKDLPFSSKSDDMNRRSRFEPEYSQSQDSPYYNSPNINTKAVIPEMPFKDIRSAPQDFHSQNRNPWSSPADSSNWPPKQSGLLEPPAVKNGDFGQAVPMDLEQTPPHDIPPIKNQYQHSEPYMAPRIMHQEKQWPSTPSMSVVISGLPPDARIEEVIDVFRNANIPPTSICIVTSSQGAKEAFLRFSNTADFQEAVNGQPRYIRNYRCDITKISDALFEAAIGNPMATKLRPKPRPKESDLCVQLKGLPYSSKEAEIERFFEDLKIVDIVVELSSEGRSVGIAFVQFATEKDFRMALTMNGKMIGHRFITISVASKDHIMIARRSDSTQNLSPKVPPIADFDIRRNDHATPPLNKPNPVLAPPILPQPAINFCITLKGMPITVTNQDIVEFFREVSGAIRAIHLMLGPDKRPSGDAYVEFGTKAEATAALNKNGMVLLGSRVFISPIAYGEMIEILNGPKPIPPPPVPGPLLKTPLMSSPEKSRKPLLEVPPPQNDFIEPSHNHMKSDQPHFEDPREKFPPHDRSRPDYSRGDPSEYPPRGRPHSDHPPRDRPPSDHPPRDRYQPDHSSRDRPPSEYPAKERPRSEFPRGERPPSDFRHGDRPSTEYRHGEGPPRNHSRNDDHPPRGERSFPPSNRDFPSRGERPPRGSFPPNERPPPPDFPQDERPHPSDFPPDDFPHGEELPPPPEFPGGDRPPPHGERPPPHGFNRGGGPPRGFPRGERPPMHPDFAGRERPRFEPRFRGGRPPLLERGMRPPFGRMRGPFPGRPGGPPPHDPASPAGFGAPGCVVSLNNLHYDAGLEELYDFFKDYHLTKDNIIRRFDESGRATSEARVSFQCPADAQRVVRELNKRPIMGRSVFLSLL